MMNKYNALERLTAIEKEATELRKILEAPEVKELPKTWAELEKLTGVYINNHSCPISQSGAFVLPHNHNTFPTKSDAYRYGVLLPQLLQLRRVYIDSVEEGWEADWTGAVTDNHTIELTDKHTIERAIDQLEADVWCGRYRDLSFPTLEIRDKFLEAFRPQLRIFFELDPIPTDI